MNILQSNPYRLLGVYSNSPTKERLANHNRMKAFLKVGKPVSFPLDLSNYLSPINRTEASVADAEAKLTLPKDQILYAQFWFLKTTPLDDVAFNHLIAGEIDKAEKIWQKRDCASSLQNRIVCALICRNYSCAITCAEVLYENTQYINQFVSAIIGTEGNIEVSNLVFSFLDVLCGEVGINKLLPFITKDAWKSHIGEKAVKPLVDSIQEAVEIAKKSKGKGSNARLNAGEELRKNTRNALSQLNKILSLTDLQYQMIADKLGLEILQCGIDYFNDSEEPDAAHKAMNLQKYAKSIVVGQMAKDRCKENVDILQRIIDNLPPSEVFMEDRAIHEELRKYCLLPDKICHAVTLLNNTKPHIQSIKRKLGISNSYYLKISTQVVGNALSNIIAEVNEAQSIFSADKDDPNATLAAILGITHVKSVLEEAWKATKIMDGFDMESEYKNGRYNENRSILKGLCDQLGVSTSAYTSSSSSSRPTQRKPTSTARSSASTTNRASANRQTTSTNSYSSSSSNSSSNNGCLIAFIVWIVLGCIAGAICVANDGDFAAGFCIAGVLVLIGSGLFNQ
ncbi:hypothetical protein [Segatella copri]|uniref:hypothetical protein n=1 Tax=Segatella copri TaxID=165179 RepID=UPI00222EFB15|nr:hypothetical protein [Segatella copri]MCW4102786.1 hypothetical protein [Segatella copri]